MRKHVLWIFLILLAAMLLAGLPGAGADTAVCDHSQTTSTVIAEPTCTENGRRNVVCGICEAVWEEDIPARGHTPETIPGKAATCTESGLTEGSRCSVCGVVLTAQQEIGAPGHAWDGGSVTTAPGCTTDGVRTYTCTACGTTRTEAIPATGQHSWDGGSVTAAPGCTTDGVRTYTCTACGTAYTETIPAAGHKPETLPAVAPTCETPGKTEGSKCSVCGEILSAQQELPAKGHEWGAWQEGSAPTCTQKGKNYRYCTVCNKTEYRDDIEPLGHDWDEGVVTKEAGYLTEGEILYTCRRDPSHTQTEKIPAKTRNDPGSVSALMNIIRLGDPPKAPEDFTPEPLKLVKDLTDMELPEDGSGVVLSVEVSGGTPPYSYKWFCTHDIKGEEVTEKIGGDSPECPVYEPGIYDCTITDSLKAWIPSSTVHVYEPIYIWYQPDNANLKTYDQMYCGAEGGVPPYSYQWQICSESGAAPIPDAPDEDYIQPELLNLEADTLVNCLVTDQMGNQIASEPGLVYSAEPLQAWCTEPLFLREGEKAEFGVWGKGGVPPYAAVWMDSMGKELPTELREDGFYMTTTSNGGYNSYWCILTDSAGKNVACETSYDYRQLTITQQPQGGTLPRGGGEHVLTVGVADGKEPYRFSLFNPIGDNQIQEGNFSECSFTVTEPAWYEIYIEDAEGNYGYTDIAAVDSYETLHIADYTSYEYITEPGGSAVLSVTAEGGKEPYSYSWKLEEHGPYDPELFGTATLPDAPSIEVYEPGAVYSCTVTDADGDQAAAELKALYAGGIWVVEQPKDISFSNDPNDRYTVSLECQAISASNYLTYQWYARDMYGHPYPVTIERGDNGGNLYEFTGNSKQAGGRYYCRIRDWATGEEKDTDRAYVTIPMDCIGVTQTDLDNQLVSLEFQFTGGTPPYHVEVGKWLNNGTSAESDEWVDDISRYTLECDGVFYPSPGANKKGASYQVYIRDSMGGYYTTLYTCTLPDPGVPAKITFDY